MKPDLTMFDIRNDYCPSGKRVPEGGNEASPRGAIAAEMAAQS